jgi:hypothetical protein
VAQIEVDLRVDERFQQYAANTENRIDPLKIRENRAKKFKTP